MKKIGTRRSTGRAVFGVLAVLLTAASLAGCGGTTNGTPAAGEIDVRKLPIGNFSTDPLDVRYTYQHNARDAKEMALARLMDNVVIGADVDPKFSHNVTALLMDSLDSAHASRVLAGAVEPVLKSNGMMFGFSAAASTRALPKSREVDQTDNFNPFGGALGDPESTAFNVTVLQFPDQQRAQVAADQMEAADFAVAADQNVRVTLSKQPSAKAHWRPGVPSMAATVSHGQYVVNVYVAQPKPDLDGLRELTDQVLTAQLPLLDQAPALSPHEIFRLDYDPDAMLRRTLHPRNFFEAKPIHEAIHTPRGHLHLVDDQATWKPLLDANGVDRISTASSGGLLFRTRDANAAAKLWSGIVATTSGSVEAPANVPDVSCTENKTLIGDAWWGYYVGKTGGFYVCTLRYDRYVARVAGDQLIQAQQAAAAQYALLANSQYM
ncbi:hypothetical protein GPX89_17015 [Nocardia sp. ET3-3]|uniref:Lipoprotein n=1 Tax=Nocardia terrae TaxID=2675851 RepID=A0A7K1UX28_9NOCA|nr:hypothetical protein [Nocardia terrae]MVU78940.1 hypothetical protein [Nocardia terrae]